MTRRVVLFGASGYTGRRAAEELVARGAKPVLAGRDRQKLAVLAQRLGGLPTAAVDLGSVHQLISGDDVLVSTVGPFLRLGQAAVAAAVAAGAIYLDSTGEPPFIRQVFERFGPPARRGGASLLTAFGYDFVPGNLAGALALRRAGPAVRRVDIGYFVTGPVRLRRGRGQTFSRGTFASLLEVAAAPGYTWRDGIRTEPSGMRMRTFRVAGRDRPALSVGASEQFTLPRLVPELSTVDVFGGWFGSATRAIHLSARLSRLARLPGPGRLLSRLAQPLVSRVAAEPDPGVLRQLNSHVVAAAYDGHGVLLTEVHLAAPDPYLLTARLLAWGAWRAAEHGVRGSGALGPVEAFGLDVLAAGAHDIGLGETDEQS